MKKTNRKSAISIPVEELSKGKLRKKERIDRLNKVKRLAQDEYDAGIDFKTFLNELRVLRKEMKARGIAVQGYKRQNPVLCYKLRKIGYEFLALQSLGIPGVKILKQKGYAGSTSKDFIKFWEVGHCYLTHLRGRDDFMGEYYKFVSKNRAKNLPRYMDFLHYRDPLSHLQLIYPEEVGRALTKRNVNVNAEADDDKFLDEFFNLKPKKASKKKEESNIEDQSEAIL